MAGLAMNPAFWVGKRVLVTGHTGFKGTWLLWLLHRLGAKVAGLALPATSPSLFELTGARSIVDHHEGDIRDLSTVRRVMGEVRPEIVLHLAAQALVRESYNDPVSTYGSNVMGTLHVLEAIRSVGGVRACVVVTTDKIYANREWQWPYRENEALGGHDPYSASKACCELLAESYAASFFAPERYAEHGVAIATARAGNVLGGGDFATNRLIPDVLAAWSKGGSVTLRYPSAVRPWQHVLEPLSGYLLLAERLTTTAERARGAWNFGPAEDATCTVERLVQLLARDWPQAPGVRVDPAELHEAGLLKLDSSRAREYLGWRPRWSLETCLSQTLAWHRAWHAGLDPRQTTQAQIDSYLGAS
ncbi:MULTISPECIES: CDP-glucose 4,6-dehydratase [unclassified Pseudomonas]|uniref:CDP-glucose 4,6-dehydratase n=1 Tax=unclassified Pseudomonas TaxID=196821 RepID=UPI00236201D5|nr:MULTISPECIES: CDP-glucose 4,6-dehydratase [unclassified Pseudomonas]